MTPGRVAVTGLGIISPIGNNVRQFWTNLCAGSSGVGPITLFDASGFKTRIAAEVRNFCPPDDDTQKKHKRLDRFALFALAAAHEAWHDAGLVPESLDPYQVGVVIGSSHGGENTEIEQIDRLRHAGASAVSPFLIPRMLSNMASAQVAMTLGIHGPNFGVSSACATGSHAIGEAGEIIKRGDAQVMICGGAEACITPLTLAGDDALGGLSHRNEDPQGASRPFDADRDGFVLGEGAGILVIEEMEHAIARGARIHANLSGYGATSDAAHETRPTTSGHSAARAITRALEKAGISPHQVSSVFAHAAGTVLGDRAEVQALKLALGSALPLMPVPAIKSTTGHLLGATGAVQAVAAIKSIQHQVVPPTINRFNPDPECDVDCVPNEARDASLTYVLSNSFGFGGHNSCLVLKKYES